MNKRKTSYSQRWKTIF